MIIDMCYFWPTLLKVYCVDRRWSSSSIQNWPGRSCIGHRTNCQKRRGISKWGRNLNPHNSQRSWLFTYRVSWGRTTQYLKSLKCTKGLIWHLPMPNVYDYEFSQSRQRTEHEVPVPCFNLRCMIQVAPQSHATCRKAHFKLSDAYNENTFAVV